MRVLITGAASGMGRGLALALAHRRATLFLGDTDAEGLMDTHAACTRLGACVRTDVLDVRNREGMAAWIASTGGLDHVFACAGITGGRQPRDAAGAALEREERVRAMVDINVTGVLNTFYPVMALMRHRKPNPQGIRGRFCVISSVAGFVAYPGTPSYCASKAAVDRLIVGSASHYEPLGITLTSVCCGFVNTPMAAPNRFPMPGLVSTDRAVRHILRGTAQGRRRVIFPRWLVLGARFSDLLPRTVSERCYTRQPSAQPGGMPDF